MKNPLNLEQAANSMDFHFHISVITFKKLYPEPGFETAGFNGVNPSAV